MPKFLKNTPDLLADEKQMLSRQLIKQSLPFTHISPERLIELSSHVETVHIASGEIIFNEGDAGDCCYLIHSGKIEISTKKTDGSKHILAILQSPALFGEATLLTHTVRNATASALTDCELLKLPHEYLSELLESERDVAKALMTLMVDRSRPLQNPQVKVHQHVLTDGKRVVILKNPDNGSYFKLSEEGFFIWQQMNGEKTMQEITMRLAEEHHIFSPDVVASLISQLAKAQFISNVNIHEENITQSYLFMKIFTKVRGILNFKIAFQDSDQWITILYHRVGFLFFSALGKWIESLIIILGLFAFAYATPHILALFQTVRDSWYMVVLLIPFTLLSAVLHELGHALTVKSYGREIHHMGVGWQWVTPIAFTDTSDMWLNPARSPRIFVNLAGIMADCIIAGMAAIFVYIVPLSYLQIFLWLFALYAYLSAFRMLNPLQELDGYYVLVDFFDYPYLRRAAIAWAVKEFPKAIQHPHLFKNQKPIIVYLLACILFLILITLIVWAIQTFILAIFGLKEIHFYISIILPLIVAVFSCVGIIVDMKNQAEE